MTTVQTDAYTGKKVWLITKAQVRYEGTVVKLDKVERAMHLAAVRSFGTEGRKNGQGEIPPKDNIIESVVFKIELVQNFEVITEEPKPEPEKLVEEVKEVQKPKHVQQASEYPERKLEKYIVANPAPLQAPVTVNQPKDKSVDEDDESYGFFDTITNSTVVKEERPRGGRGRGNRGFESNRGGFRGDA